ncbi:MAG: ATP-binding protein [Saprospiraceae bacterium]|nr:ATP-binding protein [Saprospiraceae bacterium]
MIERALREHIERHWADPKAIVVLGPRQVGKTTLLRQMCAEKGEYLYLNADDPGIVALLDGAGEARLRQIIGRNTILFIDEAQRVPNIGLTLKIVTDQIPGVKLIVTGSSALDLASEVNEPLTGRKWEYRLYPVAWSELTAHTGFAAAHTQLEQRLLFGMYPEVLNQTGDEEEVLAQLAGSYLYKDLLNFGGIRKPEVLDKLLLALALQTGSEVSYNELAQLLQIDRGTVEQYIGLLEKAYIVFRLPPLSRNLRNEIGSSRKIYFWDTGIRNAVLKDFKPLARRADTGAIWENFLISERLKRMEYRRIRGRAWFWRTYQQQEIDYVEEVQGEFAAYEFKWNPQAKTRFPEAFVSAYQPVDVGVVHREGFDGFLG